MLPIVRRELQVAARKRTLYWQRLLIGGAAALLALCFMVFGSSVPTAAGSYMFAILSWGVFFITLLDGIRCTGDAISWERREGTLGLLFLTDLRAYDIVLGKFVTAAIQTLTTLLVTFPILALPLIMGGVTPGEWTRTIVTLLTTALFSLTTALFFSAISIGALTAMATAAGFIALCIAPGIALRMLGENGWQWVSGPLSMLQYSDATQFSVAPEMFWKALTFSVSLSLLMLILACWAIGRRCSFDVSSKSSSWWKRMLEPKPTLAKTFSEMGLMDPPALWLATRTLPGRRALWILTATGGVLCCLLMIFAKSNIAMGAIFCIQISFCFLVKLWIGVVAPQSLHAARTSGALELLLCTPIRPANLVRGQMEALRSYIFPPAIVVCIGYPMLCILSVILGAGDFKQFDVLVMMILGGLFWFVIFLLDFFAIAYTGLWFALTSARIEQAVAKTIGYVLILPWLLVIFPFVGWMAFLLWPVFWICWSSHKVSVRFLAKATEQFVRSP